MNLSSRQLLGRLALDLAAWCCMPAAFLLLYVYGHSVPGDAVLPHLRLVILALLGLTLVRLVLAVLIASPRGLRLAASLVTSTLLAVMILYYALVLIGLQSWGRVVSWELIASYSPQVLKLADALAISIPLSAGLLALGYLALLAGAWTYLKRFDWTPYAARHAPSGVFALVLIFGSTAWAFELARFLAAPPAERAEPVSLTFYPMEGAWNLQGHVVDRLSAARLDAREDAARAAYEPAAQAERRNVILIVVDALRPDHMGIYGYGRGTTPNLARLERAGRMRKARSLRAACSASACGLLSISSSKFVHQFSSRPILLQEILRRHGYRVHMILSGDHTAFYGLRQAYGELDSYYDGRTAGRWKYMNDDELVLERLAAFPAWDGVPVMMQFHLMATHALGRRANAAPQAAPWADSRGPLIDTYDSAVLRADAHIRRILETLERKGYLRNAVVAITSDHGEALGEHGRYNHTNSVREEVLRIPFVLVSYGYRPARGIDGRALASQVDIAPTLLEELAMRPPRTWSGAPLQEAAAGGVVYFQQHSEVGFFDPRDPGEIWKYWINFRTGEEYAFNLRLDPGETANAIGELPPQRVREWRVQALPGTSVFVQPGTF
jgi:glucan phosphoethanolaminetransferase (alkaline phosphatase superfamily)